MDELDQRDRESRDADPVGDENTGEELIEPYLKLSQPIFKVSFGDMGSGVEFFESFGYALGLCTRKTALLELLDDVVSVDHQRLHLLSIPHAGCSCELCGHRSRDASPPSRAS